MEKDFSFSNGLEAGWASQPFRCGGEEKNPTAPTKNQDMTSQLYRSKNKIISFCTFL
jgi:hypothetical protein